MPEPAHKNQLTRVLAIRLVQWLGWVFATQERKKSIINKNSALKEIYGRYRIL